EINTGEAGIHEWFEALEKYFHHWDIYQPKSIGNGNAARSTVKPDLHLSVSVRSYRAEKLSDFVAELIDGDSARANKLLLGIAGDYPVVVSRELERVRTWLRQRSRGSERYGLVASSGAMRLKPYGLNARFKIEPIEWFLNDRTDVRSSFYLEDIASEFDIQGL